MFLSQKDVVLSNAFSVFSAFIKMNMRYLYFIPLIEYITLTDFQILNKPCVPGMNFVYNHFYMLLHSVN